MHVFIDTNILLSFYHYAQDELDALNDVFASHKHGSAEVHLTRQVRDEYLRNREGKIKDALNTFNSHNLAPKFPLFMKGYEEYAELKRLTQKASDVKATLLKRLGEDIIGQNLVADKLIKGIFSKSQPYDVTDDMYRQAAQRMALGNPPGKKGSLGDAVNWLLLLQSVPNNKTIHVISHDGDFFSTLDENAPHPFLADEWKSVNGGQLRVYRSLSLFMKEHFDGVAFAFDEDKQQLIEALHESGSFAATHSLVASLDKYGYFSLKEVNAILDAAVSNDQFGGIATDYDVCSFLYEALLPHVSSLSKNEHKDIWAEVAQQHAGWEKHDA